MVFLFVCIVNAPESASDLIYQLVEQSAARFGVQGQPAVDDVQFGHVGQDGGKVEVMEGFQGRDLFPGDFVQGLLPFQQAVLGEGRCHLHLLLEFAPAETVEVDIQVFILLRSQAGDEIQVVRAAQFPVQEADFGIAQVQVEAEELPQEFDRMGKGAGIEVRVQFLGLEAFEEEIQRFGVFSLDITFSLRLS